MRKHLFLSFFLSVILFTQCNREDKNCDGIQTNIDQEMIDYFGCFKEGSWWIYQDSISGNMDTVRVRKYERGRFVSGKGNKECIGNEFIYIWTDNSKPNPNYTDYGYWFRLSSEYNHAEKSTELYFYECVSGSCFAEEILYKKKDSYYFGVTQIEDTTIFLKNIVIRNKTYNDIIHTTNYYYSKKIGIIKHQEFSGAGNLTVNYELIDYHINY